jgi:hypothetical protein
MISHGSLHLDSKELLGASPSIRQQKNNTRHPGIPKKNTKVGNRKTEKELWKQEEERGETWRWREEPGEYERESEGNEEET